MIDPHLFISVENRTLLSRVYSDIVDREDLALLLNPRRLGPPDHPDLCAMGPAGMTIYDLFAYARRPRREVLTYMLSNMPQTLDALLTNTRTKMAPES